MSVKNPGYKTKVPTEDSEQRVVCRYLRIKHIPFFSPANQQGLSAGNRQQAARMVNKLKAIGLSPGIPDLIIFFPGKLLAIEMKRIKGGKVSENQRRWIETINKLPYAEAHVCNGADEAIALINRTEKSCF